MEKIQVSKAELVKILEANRAKHRDLYDEACKNFLTRAQELLQQKLQDANKGILIDTRLGLPIPEDHTKDYDRVLRMLSLEQRDTIELEEHDVQMYVMDEWNWRRAWAANTASYTGSAHEYAD